jgi:UDP-N-acetylglucosamine 4,6-dehydratase
LKQVPQCEDHPREAYLTNVTGTENVCLVAQEAGARVVLLSTDKAVLPVGVMGATKMLAEAVATSYGFNVVRYGNVIGSRGSILPVFREQIARGVPITITDPLMTRFLITLDEAIRLLDRAMDAAAGGHVYVRKSPAATVEQFVRVLSPGYPTQVIGVRPGEKRHEDLLAPHELATDCDYYFIVERNKPGGATYTSEHAPRLSDEALAALL